MQLAELATPLGPGEPTLHYQIKVRPNLKEIQSAEYSSDLIQFGHITGTEALIRWQLEAGGVLGASAVLPHIQRLDLSGELAKWVLEAACIQHKLWLSAGVILPMSINMEPNDLNEPGLLDHIRRVLQAHGISERDLTIEVLEEQQITKDLLDLLQVFRGHGIKVAIDDYGKKYANADLMHRLFGDKPNNPPVDEIKLDRIFLKAISLVIKDLSSSDFDDLEKELVKAGALDSPEPRPVNKVKVAAKVMAFMEALIMFVHKAGSKATIEGVENPFEWWAIMKSLEFAARPDALEVQGYHLMQPYPSDGIIPRIINTRRFTVSMV